MKNEFNVEDSSSDDLNADIQIINDPKKINKVAKIIDVSEGIKKEDTDIFITNQKLLAEHHRRS